MSEHAAPSQPEQKAEKPAVYYISKEGSIWSPMYEVGSVSDTQGNVKRYILGDTQDLSKTTEVPADWFDAYKDELHVKEGEPWGVVGKPTLETQVVSPEASAEHNEVLSVGAIEELGHNALGASGIEAPAAEPTEMDKLLDRAPVLRHFESQLKQIASMRARERSEGYRHGMSQFDSSERMIDDLLKLASQVEKSKMGEDRRGAIYRYID